MLNNYATVIIRRQTYDNKGQFVTDWSQPMPAFVCREIIDKHYPTNDKTVISVFECCQINIRELPVG